LYNEGTARKLTAPFRPFGKEEKAMLKSLGVAMVVIGFASADSDSVLPPIIMIAVGMLIFKICSRLDDERGNW
jgi:hypothetical protein